MANAATERALADSDLMERRLALLFHLNPAGEMLALNEHGDPPSPAVYVGRCARGTRIAFAADLARDIRDAVSTVVAGAPPWEGGARLGPDVLAAVLPFARDAVLYHGPAFRFPPPLMAPMGAMQLYVSHAHLLHPDLAGWGPALRWRRPAFAVFRERQVVAICASARLSVFGAEAGVETASAYRGQGCAQMAVDAWASAIREKGLVPFYSTSWENQASRSVAAKLDLQPIGEDIHISWPAQS